MIDRAWYKEMRVVMKTTGIRKMEDNISEND